MTVRSRCFGRLAGSLICVLAAVALFATPVAWANDDTISAQATVPFSGPVENPASCPSVTGGTCGAPDTFTANVSTAPPMFTQCPPVDKNTGCQFLITIGNGSATIHQDPNQGPYEADYDDSLIGVQNNSSSTIDELPLSVPGSDLFGFDQDGICDAASPVPSGCTVLPGSPAGSSCGNGARCAFPPAPGEPGPDQGAYSGSTQNGYEGPTSYFTNISSDVSSGVVHFSPGIPPGGSSYFSLEQPPLNATIGVGGTSPYSPGLQRPTVTATGATFSSSVNPNGSATTAYYQYGLDLRYVKRGESGPDYTHSTPVQTVGSDFADHPVTAIVSGLVPNALYHVRIVATNGSGTTFGPDMTFTTKRGVTPGSPRLGRNVNISLVSGLVLVRLHGVFIPLTELTQIPTNTEINALAGSIKLITAVPGPHSAGDPASAARKHKGKAGKTSTQSGTFGGAIFKVTQARSGLATLALVESAFKGAPSFSECGGKKAGDATAASLSSRTLQLLHANARGRFATRGRYAAATVRGTIWTIADKCDGTLTHDISDSVVVTDFVHHTTITLHAGQSYLAKKP